MTCFSNKGLWFSARKMQSWAGYLSICCSERGRNIKTAPTWAGSWASQKKHQENHRAWYRGFCRVQEPEQGQSQHTKGCHWANMLPLSPVPAGCSVHTQAAENPEAVPWAGVGGEQWDTEQLFGESWFVSIPSRQGPWVGSLLCWHQWQNSCYCLPGQDSPSRACDTWGNLHIPTGGSALWSTTDSSLSHQGDTAFCCVCERLHQKGQSPVKHIHTHTQMHCCHPHSSSILQSCLGQESE